MPEIKDIMKESMKHFDAAMKSLLIAKESLEKKFKESLDQLPDDERKRAVKTMNDLKKAAKEGNLQKIQAIKKNIS